MFEGAAALSLDTKGRLAVPARHRETLAPEGASVVITAHQDRCLLVYPEVAWAPIRDQILAAPSFDVRATAIKRLFIGYSRVEKLDSAGRILVAPELRRFAGLEKEVWLVGQDSHFELWSDSAWQQQQDALLAILGNGMPAGLENLAL